MDDSQSRRPNRRLYIHRDQIGDWNHRPRYECQKRNANIAVGRRLPRRESLQRLRLGRRRQHLRLRVARRRGCWFLFFIFRATRDPSPAAWRARRVAPRTRCVARARAPPRRARSPALLSLLRRHTKRREGEKKTKRRSFSQGRPRRPAPQLRYRFAFRCRLGQSVLSSIRFGRSIVPMTRTVRGFPKHSPSSKARDRLNRSRTPHVEFSIRYTVVGRWRRRSRRGSA